MMLWIECDSKYSGVAWVCDKACRGSYPCPIGHGSSVGLTSYEWQSSVKTWPLVLGLGWLVNCSFTPEKAIMKALKTHKEYLQRKTRGQVVAQENQKQAEEAMKALEAKVPELIRKAGFNVS